MQRISDCHPIGSIQAVIEPGIVGLILKVKISFQVHSILGERHTRHFLRRFAASIDHND
ncbi:hypothetical protein D3C81_2069070 [compost metagenome]